MFLIIILCTFVIVSCSKLDATDKQYKCVDCHKVRQEVTKHSDISCILCHGGMEPAQSKREAHLNLRSGPDHSTIEKVCGNCHGNEAEKFKNSLHFTYKRELETILQGFKLRDRITMKDLAQMEPSPTSVRGLIFDFLKRRCLSCHVFTAGENYPQTKRGLYCLSCHPAHSYSKPTDESCLSCHYSIRIGWDYYGFFPHNWYIDYRSPFVEGKLPERPFGIEAYHLEEDVHKKRGFNCSKCHTKGEIMYGERGKTCTNCHQNFRNELFHRGDLLKRVRCEVCHARYLSQDELKACHLVFEIDIEKWEGLLVQESSEIEEKLTAYLLGKSIRPQMRDKFNGKEFPGLWLCTLANRTFSEFSLGKDKDGRICLKRIEKIELYSENVSVRGIFEKCKVPHTIGGGDLNRSLYLLQRVK